MFRQTELAKEIISVFINYNLSSSFLYLLFYSNKLIRKEVPVYHIYKRRNPHRNNNKNDNNHRSNIIK